MKTWILIFTLLFGFSSLALAAPDIYHNSKDVTMTVSATHMAAITPHDTNELGQVCRAVYVGGAGNIKMTLLESGTETLTGVPVGLIIPARPLVVWATGTTATNLICFW